ncbi:MAG TPA: ABC transporter permease [Ilumatobacter sp.]|nr:ABC transporter permease [Ilumatobacter sp.]
MFLALREIRRGLVRFGMLAVAIGLLLFLVLFQQALQQGLVTAFVGAIRNQSAPVIVYGIDAQRALQGSMLTPDVEQQVLAVDGIGEHNRIGETTLSVRVGDAADATEASLIGTDGPLGQPRELAAGRAADGPNQAVGSSVDFAVGDMVTVLAPDGGFEVEVVGVADDVQLSVSPTLFTDYATFEAAVQAFNPDAAEIPASALAVAPARGVEPAELVDRINDQVGDADAVTRADAADSAPGVAQVRQSFQVILGLYALIVPLVTGLFFLIITLQKARALVLLRAIGARSGVLLRALFAQVLMITLAGIAVGVLLALPLSGRQIGGLTLRYDPASVATWALVFVALAVVGALASLARVRRTEPVAAVEPAGGAA